MGEIDESALGRRIISHRFLDEAGDTTFYGKGRIPIIGEAGVSHSFSIGMVKFKGDLEAVRASIREMQQAVVADEYLKAIPSVAKKGAGKGFYFQMEGFENGRIQTAARAVGLMQAAYEAAVAYSQNRVVFGHNTVDYQLTKVKLARMAVVIQASRQFSYEVAKLMGKGEGALEASMIKAYVCRAAEWVTREAMQIHGGMGYAEEYAVSRYFVDARVLSIFEGADETLCLKVIARRLLEQSGSK